MAADFWGFHTVIRLGAHRMHVSTGRAQLRRSRFPRLGQVKRKVITYIVVFCLRLCYFNYNTIYAFCFPGARAEARNVRGSDQRSGYPTGAGRCTRRRRRSDDIDRAAAGIAISRRGVACLLRTGPGVEIDSSRGRDPRSPRRRPDPVGTPVRQSVRMDGISSTLPAVLKYTHTLMHASCLQMRCNGSR